MLLVHPGERGHVKDTLGTPKWDLFLSQAAGRWPQWLLLELGNVLESHWGHIEGTEVGMQWRQW